MTVPFLVAGVLAVPAALACDAALESAVAARPDDSDARDALARSCLRAGLPRAALEQYDILLALDGANADWLLGKSQALMALGRPREALPLLEDARRRAPGYEDVWRLSASALDALDEFDAEDALLKRAAAQFSQSTWPRERQARLEQRRLLERGTRVSADVSYEELSGGRPAWKGASIGIDRSLGGPRHFSAGLHHEERFDTQDQQLLLAWGDRLDEKWSYGLSADVAPDAVVLPRWSLTAEAGRGLPGAWGLGLRLRHASHQAVDVETLGGTLDKYFGSYSVGYALNATQVSGIGDPHFGHVLHGAYDYGQGSRIALAVGLGEEAETVAPGTVRVTNTRSVALHGLHWTGAAWGISWEAGWYRQGDLYDRARVRLGLEHRF